MGFLDGKVAIVSGAAQGLGTAFAEALAREGANLTIFDIKEAVLDVGQAIETEYGVQVIARFADVSQRDDVERIVDETVTTFGGIDVLVNNAGKWQQTLPTDSWEKALADFDEVMDTNIKGVMMLSRATVPHMVSRGGGDIVNVSTYYVLPARSDGTNNPNTDCYNASKWAMNGFTHAWAGVLAKDNIRANALCMGATDTPMLRGLFAPNEPPEEAVKTWMKPAEIAQLMLDLMQDGRSGENVGAWAGFPVELPPRARWDVAQRMRADFTGKPLVIYGVPPWDDAPEPVEHLAVGRPS